MSGGGGGVIIIQRLVDSGQFNESECAELHEISGRSIVRCSRRDAWRVCRIVWSRIRRA